MIILDLFFTWEKLLIVFKLSRFICCFEIEKKAKINKINFNDIINLEIKNNKIFLI